MNDQIRKPLTGPLFVIVLCQLGFLTLELLDRAKGEPATVKSNSALFLAGAVGVAIASAALWKHGFRGPWVERLSVLSAATAGLLCLYFVDLPMIRASGLVVTAPFVVPIVVALVRKRRD